MFYLCFTHRIRCRANQHRQTQMYRYRNNDQVFNFFIKLTTKKLLVFLWILIVLFAAVHSIEFVDEYTDYFNLTSITNYSSCKTAIRSNEYFGYEGYAQLPIIDGYRFHEVIVVYKAVGDCEQNLAVMRRHMICQINISRSGCTGSSPGHFPKEGCYCNYATGRQFYFTINKTALHVVKHHQLCVNHPRTDVEYLGSIALPTILYHDIPVTISVNDEEMNLTQCQFKVTNRNVSLHFCTEYLVHPKLTIAVGKQSETQQGSCIQREMVLDALKQTVTFNYSGDCGQEKTYTCQLLLTDPSIVEKPEQDTPTATPTPKFPFNLPHLEFIIGAVVGGILLMLCICYMACRSRHRSAKKRPKISKKKISTS